jgi:hypothetical protein
LKSLEFIVFAGGFSLMALAGACGGAAATDLSTPPAVDADGGSSGTSGGMSSGGTSGSPGDDGGSGTGADAAIVSPFTAAPAYTPTTGRSTLKPGDHPGTGNPSKLACFDCHGGSGPGPTFFAAGSVFKDAAGTMPAAQVEVRLLADNGSVVSTYSDNLGNFVVTARTASTAGVTFPLHAGARNGTATQVMSAAPTNGNCNNTMCHGGSQGWIHVP